MDAAPGAMAGQLRRLEEARPVPSPPPSSLLLHHPHHQEEGGAQAAAAPWLMPALQEYLAQPGAVK